MPADSTAAPTLKARLAAYREVDPRASWARLLSTIALLTLAWPPLFLPLPLALRAALAVAVAGLLLRLCSVAHDWAHGAILRGSRPGAWLAHAISLIVLAPVRIWQRTHNHHHAHNALIGEPAIGTFPLWTAEEHRRAGALTRLAYRLVRSPAMMLAGWPLVFVVSLNVAPLLRDPRRYWSSAVALLLHAGLHVAAVAAGGVETWLLAVAVPYTLMSALGAYLFYVQHNYPGACWHERAAWSAHRAALASSSYMGMPRLLHWVTGNIGYHHIHHLDPLVPFYRLPEAFTREAELTRAPDTSFRPRDIALALDLALWDSAAGRLIRWSELRARRE